MQLISNSHVHRQRYASFHMHAIYTKAAKYRLFDKLKPTKNAPRHQPVLLYV